MITEVEFNTAVLIEDSVLTSKPRESRFLFWTQCDANSFLIVFRNRDKSLFGRTATAVEEQQTGIRAASVLADFRMQASLQQMQVKHKRVAVLKSIEIRAN